MNIRAEVNTDEKGNDLLVDVPSTIEKFFYGLGSFGWLVMIPITGSFLTYFFTDVVGLGAAFVGTLLLVGRVFDGFTDIGMGLVVDKTKSKLGQARPWILWMSLPMTIAFVLLFTMPEISLQGREVYAYVSYILYTLLYTAVAIPYTTLLGLMTQDSNHRATTNVFRGLFSITGYLLVMVLFMPTVNSLGGDKRAWILVAATLALITFITVILGFWKVKERVETKKEVDIKVPLKESLKVLITNKYWFILMLYGLANNALTSIVTGGGIFYVAVVFGNTSYFSILAAATLLPCVISLAFIGPIAKKYGKRNTALVITAIGFLGAFIKLFYVDSLPVIVIGYFFLGFALVAKFTLFTAMVNDTVEYSEWKSNIRITGLINSAESMGEKVGTGLGGAAVGWLLAYAGYVGGVTNHSAEVVQMVVYTLNNYIPLLLCFIQVVLLYFYKLDKMYPTILKDILERQGKMNKFQ